MMYLYGARNFSALVDLASPEPMANMYDATYFRATWVLTALDAGFWTAMKIRTKWLRDLASFVFTLYYLVATQKADEKVRKVRGMLTVEHLRVAWNKGTTPYLGFLQRLVRPRFTRWPPRQVRIPRPANSDYKEPVMAWLYYDGPLAELAHHNRLILDIPGGGFVAMDPRCNDDKLFAWAAKTGLPILSIDYRKAPEYPYPYAVNEIFDVYATIDKTAGSCIGMSGKDKPRIIITGDSAGGNLAVASTLMILETESAQFQRPSGRSALSPPDGMVLFYPTLDMNIGNWMTDEQMSLIRDRKMRKTNKPIVRRKSAQYNELVGTPHHSDEEDETPSSKTDSESLLATSPSAQLSSQPSPAPRPEFSHNGSRSLTSARQLGEKKGMSHHPEPMRTRLATSSIISYFNDRVLTPEMMRAMIILYIGPHNRPDFSKDYLLSPVLAPEALLARFPKTFFMTGERDPLVDDTVIFAGRLRRAKEAAARAKLSRPLGTSDDEGAFDDRDVAEVLLIPGTSHGFMQFPGVYPPAWKHFERSAGWFEQLFADADHHRTEKQRKERLAAAQEGSGRRGRSRKYSATESSGDEDRPLEISMTKLRGKPSNASTAQTSTSSPAAAAATTQGEGQGQSRATEDGGGQGQDGESSASPPAMTAERRPDRNGGKKSKKLRGNRSLVKLSSSDDLLGRRMHGLTSGLTRRGDDDDYTR
ncbi:Hormone-sensitive lipase [Escovopsis weberi]|uniref:Hormone-sensitive lipase n=1 Tax=Escovopsis weberi TaxID=150374 RepID=A0A0M8N805_ESCWE|nr:Hormone-sensitive lipase [Escovopsis weberi]